MHVWVEWWSCSAVVVHGVLCGRRCYVVLGRSSEGLVMLSFVVCVVVESARCRASSEYPRWCYSIKCGVEGRPRVGGFESCQDRGEGPQAGDARGCPGRKKVEPRAPRTGLVNVVQCVVVEREAVVVFVVLVVGIGLECRSISCGIVFLCCGYINGVQ